MGAYLKEVGRPVRLLAILLLGLVTTALIAMDIMVVIAVTSGARQPPSKLGPIIAGGLFFLFINLFTVAFGWMLIRLLREKRTADKATIIPVRFIQGFGVFFLAAAVAAGVRGMVSPGLAVSTSTLGLSMISLPLLIQRREVESARR